MQCLSKILTRINELRCVLSRNSICKEYHTKPKLHIHVYTNPISVKYQTSLSIIKGNHSFKTKGFWLTLFEIKFVSTYTYSSSYGYRVHSTVLRSVDDEIKHFLKAILTNAELVMMSHSRFKKCSYVHLHCLVFTNYAAPCLCLHRRVILCTIMIYIPFVAQ